MRLNILVIVAALGWSACLAPAPMDSQEPSSPEVPEEPTTPEEPPVTPEEPPATPEEPPVTPEEPPATPEEPPVTPEEPPVTPEEPPGPTGEGTLCPALKLAPSAPFMLQTNSKDCILHQADGTAVDITETLTQEVPAGASLNDVTSAASPGYYGALATWSINGALGAIDTWGTEATLVAYDGDVVWRVSLPKHQWTLHPDAQGRALIASEGGTPHRWVDASGQVATLDDAFRGVLSGPKNGRALVKVYRDGEHRRCWVDLDANTELGCVEDSGTFAIVDGALVQFDEDEKAPSIQRLTAEDMSPQTIALQLPEVSSDYQLFQTVRSGLALIGDAYGEQLFRVDLATGEFTPVTPTVPAGWKRMAACHASPQVGLRDDGTLVVGLLDAALGASLFGYDPDTDTMDQLTAPITGTGHLRLQAGKQGYTVEVEGWSSYYCFQPSMADADTSAPMESLRMYAPNDDSHVTEIKPGWAPTSLHPSGLCALQYGDPDAFVDVTTGTMTQPQGGFGDAVWLMP